MPGERFLILVAFLGLILEDGMAEDSDGDVHGLDVGNDLDECLLDLEDGRVVCHRARVLVGLLLRRLTGTCICSSFSETTR